MPPRFAYWTIIVDGKPTAFRAHEREELLPTFKQLQGKHPDAAMMWFARGKLWASPEDAQAETAGGERRTTEWRPGGEHRDPRARFKVPRDQKRARFAARLRREGSREPQPGDGTETPPPQPGAEGTGGGPRPERQFERDRRPPDQRDRRPDRQPFGARKPPFAREGGDRDRGFERDRRPPDQRERRPAGKPFEARKPPFAREGGDRDRKVERDRRPPDQRERRPAGKPFDPRERRDFRPRDESRPPQGERRPPSRRPPGRPGGGAYKDRKGPGGRGGGRGGPGRGGGAGPR